jgi:hypothetical protein
MKQQLIHKVVEAYIKSRDWKHVIIVIIVLMIAIIILNLVLLL